MKNRAKCRLCQTIIESFHSSDYVSCKCGEISIDGGNDRLYCGAKDFANFMRVDDEGNEIAVKIVEKTEEAETPTETPRPTRKEKIEMLEAMIKNIEGLPQHAMSSSINHYDLHSFMILLLSILREDS